MKIIKGIKIRIYPNEIQKQAINQNIGNVRFVYNQTLAKLQDAYKNNQKVKPNEILKSLKKENNWLKLSESTSLQQAQKDLYKAYQNFFEKKHKFPRFHSKHNSHQSYRSQFVNNNIQIFKDEKLIKIPKIGYMKFAGNIYNDILKINNITISKTPANKYYASICCEVEYTPIKNPGCIVGLDVGIKEFYTDSNGNEVHNPKYLEKALKKLKRLQRKHSKTQKQSSNREKARIKLAKQYEKITNQRNDFLHKLTHQLISENQVIVVENLKIKNMLKNHKLAQAISSVSWSKFFLMLTYKASWNGNEIIKVDTFYPSSKTCNHCGYKNKNLTLSDRVWECPNCHTKLERDKNAAKNILEQGLKQIQNTVGTTGINASGEKIRPVNMKAVSLKEESIKTSV